MKLSKTATILSLILIAVISLAIFITPLLTLDLNFAKAHSIRLSAQYADIDLRVDRVVSFPQNKTELIKARGYPTVYYWAIDGKRYTIPNERIYYSWYPNFLNVKTISLDELSAIAIGGNVCYKPNSRLIKLKDDPKVYWVGKYCEIRHIVSEELASRLFGNRWFKQVDDIAPEFFVNYYLKEPLETDFLPAISSDWTNDDNIGLTGQ